MVSRRTLLKMMMASAIIPNAWAAQPRRLAILDWGLAETTLALGITPLAISAPDWYRKLIGKPSLPDSVQDIGLLFQPNFETLWALKPDLIVITPAHTLLKGALNALSPTLTLPVGSLANVRQAVMTEGASLGLTEQAANLLAQLDSTLTETRQALPPPSVPVLLASVIDEMHLKVFTPGSLFGDVMQRCGIANGWGETATARGWAQITLTSIALQDAQLVLIPQPGEDAMLNQGLHSTLWQHLPITTRRPPLILPEPLSDAGTIITAMRFARALTTVKEALHG